MAHGEMLMLGAYSTYVVQTDVPALSPRRPSSFYPLIALPVAFFVTAGIGMALERTVIRHLYGRPLETLLATWGISLMLIQLVRLVFGAQNVEVANPAWLSRRRFRCCPIWCCRTTASSSSRFALFVVVLTWLLLNKTRLGLNVRAVTQNRNMAACCGVPTGRVDMLAFGLGSGIAGLGGVALTPDRQRRPGPRPELHHRLVPGGGARRCRATGRQRVGARSAWASSTRSSNRKSVPCSARSLILALIILFIQKRPQGLFALKGRSDRLMRPAPDWPVPPAQKAGPKVTIWRASAAVILAFAAGACRCCRCCRRTSVVARARPTPVTLVRQDSFATPSSPWRLIWSGVMPACCPSAMACSSRSAVTRMGMYLMRQASRRWLAGAS